MENSERLRELIIRHEENMSELNTDSDLDSDDSFDEIFIDRIKHRKSYPCVTPSENYIEIKKQFIAFEKGISHCPISTAPISLYLSPISRFAQ